MLDRPATAIAAIPRDLPTGARLPMIVLLPGGEHTKQKHDHGCWAWWSDFRLGDIETALRRGTLSRADFRGPVRDEDIAQWNKMLGESPYRGSVIVTPFVINRQTQIIPHGTMITPFLRQLVERARRELPVLATRESTALAGVSVGGLWSLYCGSSLSDLFGTLLGVQPYTEDYERLLRKTIKARTTSQRIRIVTALGDRLRTTNVHLVKGLQADGIAVEVAEYPGYHNRDFAAGSGGIDMMLTLDRSLERSAPVVASTDAGVVASAAPSTSSSAAPQATIAPPSIAPPPPPRKSRLGWFLGAAGIGVVATIAIVLRRRVTSGS